MTETSDYEQYLATNGEKEFTTSDQGFAAFLAAQKFTFLGAHDTGQPMGTGMYGTKKEFVFIIPKDLDTVALRIAFDRGDESTKITARVMYSKLRLMRQACKQPHIGDYAHARAN